MAKEANTGLPPRRVVEDVLSKATTRDLWTINFNPVLPFTLQDFSVGSVIPAMIYMFRLGKRRGTGEFATAFRNEPLKTEEREVEDSDTGSETESLAPKHPVQVTHLVDSLTEQSGTTTCPPGDVTGKAILGDALLCYCVENVRHQEGRDKPVARGFTTHLFCSWFGLPKSGGTLRLVPELLVHLLSDYSESLQSCRPYAIRQGMAKNRLLSLLGKGMIDTEIGSINLTTGDEWDREVPLALDQLLTTRLALLCKRAPSTLTPPTKAEIPRQQPICRRAARVFAEDFDAILAGFGESIPRPSLMPMLESCIGLGLSNLLLSTALMLEKWDAVGQLPTLEDQHPWPLFVDASSSLDRDLQAVAENSMDDCIRHIEHVPITLSCLRVLHEQLKIDEDRPREIPYDAHDATAWLNFLGQVLNVEHHAMFQTARKDIGKNCNKLAVRLEEENHAQGIVALLRQVSIHPARRLGAALILLMGEKSQSRRLRLCLDSCLMRDEPNGWIRSRKSRRKDLQGHSKTHELRSLVLNNTALEFLVHRHLLDPSEQRLRALSLNQFLVILRERYGFFVDTAPPRFPVANELLDRNRRTLENRLRDLGLLVSVNDAKSMKRLQARYTLPENRL